MGVKDITEKILLEMNDVFAEVVNGTIFDGEEVVKSEDLREADSASRYQNDENEYKEQYRDIAKFWEKEGVIFSFIGIENQTNPDKEMILRVLQYDSVAYKKQMGNKSYYPVFTIVVYWGKEKWNAPKKLSELVTIPDRVKGLISDHHYHLLDVGRLTADELRKYKDDFNIVATIVGGHDMAGMRGQRLTHPKEAVDLLTSVTGDTRFREMEECFSSTDEERREKSMCEFLDRIEKEGFDRGEEVGIAKGMEKGKKTVTATIAKALKAQNIAVKVIMEATGLSRAEVEKL